MTIAFVGGALLFSHNKACTSQSQNDCPSSRQYICIQAKMKKKKAQHFLYLLIRGTKTFPGICLLLPLPNLFLSMDFCCFSLTGQNWVTQPSLDARKTGGNILIGLGQSGFTVPTLTCCCQYMNKIRILVARKKAVMENRQAGSKSGTT